MVLKTARVWDVSTTENKMEMRGHENVVEAVVFAPVVAYAAIQELASIEVGAPIFLNILNNG